ncbi:hypothetical protein ACOSP7_014882 [Xanthoceras sorbifolium]
MSEGASSNMVLMAVLESNLLSLSAKARCRYPAVKDGAKHAILTVTITSAFRFFNVSTSLWLICVIHCLPPIIFSNPQAA